MATSTQTVATPETASTPASAPLLVCLPSTTQETLRLILASLVAAFPGERLLISAPEHNLEQDLNAADWPSLEFVPQRDERCDAGWVLSAADFAAGAALASQHADSAILLLTDDAPGLPPPTLHSLVQCVRAKGIDLALPRYALGPTDGLVNAALLYPFTRALFATDIRSPLSSAAALSARMIAHLGSTASRPASGQTLLWPVAEAAIAGYSVREVAAASSRPPQPRETDFNALFGSVVSSLFLDIEAKAPFWQRARSVLSPGTQESSQPHVASTSVSAQVEEMIASFHLAFTNLQEIWSLVLPPQSRLALKKLASMESSAFDLTPSLWARIAYDFALAFHLRTINRGHLLGAMTPLYLAWAASHLRAVDGDPALGAARLEETVAAFEREKSYLVSRWRWPDRFNP